MTGIAYCWTREWVEPLLDTSAQAFRGLGCECLEMCVLFDALKILSASLLSSVFLCGCGMHKERQDIGIVEADEVPVFVISTQTVFSAKPSEEYVAFENGLAATSLTNVTGIVSASGAGGAGTTSTGIWHLVFFLDGWKAGDSAMHIETLRVEMPVSKAKLSHCMDRLKPYDIVMIQARIAEYPGRGSQAMAQRILSNSVADQDLISRKRKLRRPVTFDDSLLGSFVYDRSTHWYSGRPKWLGTVVSLHLETGGITNTDEVISIARELWQADKTWNEKALDCAASKLLSLKNSSWLDKGEAPLTEDAFKKRMSINSIIVWPGGKIEFVYKDGDLFWGHEIVVKGTLQGGFTTADIEG